MSKTPFLSRRAMLGRIPAAGLAAIVPATAIACPVPADLDAELLALADRMEAAHDATKAADGEHDVEACAIAEDDLASEIAQVPAKTLAGLRVKVRALFIIGELQDKQWGHPDSWEYEDAEEGLVLSLMRDILAMEA